MSTSQAVPVSGQQFRGNDKLLTGIVLGVLTFWMFAGTVGTIARSMLTDINGGPIDQVSNPYIGLNQMNLAVSITALFSGLFIVFFGGIADRVGRVRIALLGNALSIVGSVLIIFARGGLAVPLLLTGRAVQGLSAACIMPATMALVKTYWDGEGRQRAVSMWSIGSWGGSGLAALFGGFMASSFNWRSIFIASIVISVVSTLLIWGTPESRAEGAAHARFDVVGLIIFMISVLALMIVLIFGRQMGWTSPTGSRARRCGRRRADDLRPVREDADEAVRGLLTLPKHDLHRCDDIELRPQRDDRHAHRQPADAADRPSRTFRSLEGGPADHRLRRRHHRLHQGRREAAPEVRTAQADDLGLDARSPVVRAPDADQHPGRTVHDSRRDRLHAVRRGLGLLRHAIDGRRPVQPATSCRPARAPESTRWLRPWAARSVQRSRSRSSPPFSPAESRLSARLLHTQGMQSNAAIRQAGTVAFMFNLVLALIAIISITTTIPKGRRYHD